MVCSERGPFTFPLLFLWHLLFEGIDLMLILRTQKVGIDLGWLLVDLSPMKMNECPMKRDHFKWI